MICGGCLCPPQLFESFIAAAGVTIVFITNGIFLIVILVVLLGWIESRGAGDVCGNFTGKGFVIERCFALLSKVTLLGVVIKNFAAVLAAFVAELPIGIGGVNITPKIV